MSQHLLRDRNRQRLHSDTSRKHLNPAQVRPTLTITEKLGIKTTTSFITGYPDERESDHRATLDMVGELHVRNANLNTSQLHLLTPEPGTALLDTWQESLRLDRHVSGFNFPRFDPIDDRILASNPDIFPNHFHYPTRLDRERHVTASFLWYEMSQFGKALARYILLPFGSSFVISRIRFIVGEPKTDTPAPSRWPNSVGFSEPA